MPWLIALSANKGHQGNAESPRGRALLIEGHRRSRADVRNPGSKHLGKCHWHAGQHPAWCWGCPGGPQALRRTASAMGTPDSLTEVNETSGSERASRRLARLIETPVSGVSDGVAAA